MRQINDNDEAGFLEDLEKVETKAGRTFNAVIMREQRNSLRRILKRVRKGIDYSLTVKDGDIVVNRTVSNRKTLEEEYPALKKAAEQYEIVKNLVDGEGQPEN